MSAPVAAVAPVLPPGRHVELPGRGETFIRELPGPGTPDVDTLLLLHGWTGSTDLTWCTAYSDLGRRYRVVAMDLRGHGRARLDGPVRLVDCADDAAALVEVLGLDRVVATGYSMGGAVAQLLWRRHRHLVKAIVLCASAARFEDERHDRVLFGLLRAAAPLARVIPPTGASKVARAVIGAVADDSPLRAWTVDEATRHDWRRVVSLGLDLARHDARQWISDVDVPIAQVVTTRDTVVPTHRQLELARRIGTSSVHRCEGDHGSALDSPTAFVTALLAAVAAATGRPRELRPDIEPLVTYPIVDPAPAALSSGELLPTG